MDGDHLPEAVLREWESYKPEAKSQLRHLMDGMGDKDDWIELYQSRLEEQIAEFMSAMKELVSWYDSNSPDK